MLHLILLNLLDLIVLVITLSATCIFIIAPVIYCTLYSDCNTTVNIVNLSKEDLKEHQIIEKSSVKPKKSVFVKVSELIKVVY